MDSGLWQAVLGEIELSVTRASYVTWFKNTRLLKNKDDILVVGVPNVFIKQQLERKFNDLITDTLKKNGVSPERIEYKIYTATSVLHKKSHENTIAFNTPMVTYPNQNSATSALRQGLNEKYTFDNFIVGSGNELAYAACQAIAVSPGTKYNPLFVYGGVGIGKTHLIQAVGNAIMANKPSSRIVYVSTEQFVKEFIDAVRFKKNTDFVNYYRNADVVILDDIQFIAGKDKTQEEFFHTFNALHQANKQ